MKKDKLTRALVRVVRFYRKNISPLSPPKCRFMPSCSAYALEALEKFGAVKGGWLALRRILKCHPFHKGGYDPVPQELRCASCSFRHKEK